MPGGAPDSDGTSLNKRLCHAAVGLAPRLPQNVPPEVLLRMSGITGTGRRCREEEPCCEAVRSRKCTL